MPTIENNLYYKQYRNLNNDGYKKLMKYNIMAKQSKEIK